MNNTIKQHYVPKFYLKNFSNMEKNKYFIYCYDINQNKKYVANIKNIAEEKHFYKIGNQNFEEDFQKSEKITAPIIQNLSKYKKTKPLNNIKKRSQLSIFMAIQFLRTNEMRKTMLEQNSKISNYLENFELVKDMENINKMLGEQYIKHHQIGIIHDLTQNLTHEIFFKKWILLKNKTQTPFWTSDNPIVRYNPHGKIGFGCSHIHIFYPITPKLCLCLVDPTKYSNFEEKEEFSEENAIFNIKRTSSSNLKNDKKIKLINNLQAKFATKHIFSKDDDFSRIPELIEKGIINPQQEKERVELEILKNPENNNDILHFYHPP